MSVPSRYNQMIAAKIRSMSKNGPNDGDFGFLNDPRTIKKGGSGYGQNNVGRLGNGENLDINTQLKGKGKNTGEGKYIKGAGNLTSYKESTFGSTKSEDYGKLLSADKNAFDGIEMTQNFPVQQQQQQEEEPTGGRRKMKGGSNAIIGGNKKVKPGFGSDLKEGKGSFMDDLTDNFTKTISKPSNMVGLLGLGKKPKPKKSKMEGGDFLDTLGKVAKIGATVAPYALMAMGKPEKKGGANFIDKSQLQGVKGGAKPKSEWAQLVSKYSKEKGGVKNAIKYIKDNYKKENGKWIKN